MPVQLNDRSKKPTMKKPSGLLLVDKTFKKSKKSARDDTRAKAIGDLIMEMMALGDQPLTLAEDQGWEALITWVAVYNLESPLLFCRAKIAKFFHTLINSNGKDKSFFRYILDIWTCDVSPVSMMSRT